MRLNRIERARGVSGWRKRGQVAKEDGTDSLHTDVGAWLERHLAPDDKPGLLHNDFKLNNIIIDPADFSSRAVVDRDQGTHGDPLFDFATLLSYRTHADGTDDGATVRAADRDRVGDFRIYPRCRAGTEFLR